MKTGNILRNTALYQIKEYEDKFPKINRVYDELFKDLIIDKYSIDDAVKSVKKLFDKQVLNFVAIDGTEYSRPLFDMMIFYAGAYSCEGGIDFSEENNLKIRYKNKFLEHSSDVSSCVPVYIDKIPEIDRTFHDLDGKINLNSSFTEEAIINNTNVANFLMTFSEFYLAYKYASAKSHDIILMDRSLSNMYSSLLYDTSNRKVWSTNLSILDYDTDGQKLDINDLTIARYNLINEQLNLPSPRGNYLRYTIFILLSKIYPDEISLDQIIESLKINDNKSTRNRIKTYIQTSIKEGIIIENERDKKYTIVEKYRSTWTRIKKLVQELGDKIFTDEKEPFVLTKEKGKKEWLTTLDLSFLTLFSFYMLIEECWKNNILLIGITKDTTAKEFKNHVIPICLRNNIWTYNEKLKSSLEDGPSTDRMLLQFLSILNNDKINVPWSLIEYDAAFVMTIPDFRNREGYVSGAIKNNIIQSQLFLRSFVQLGKSNRDKKLRSNVLAIDRLAYPEIDLNSNDNIIQFKHDYSNIELIKFFLFKDKNCKNEIQNLLLVLLKSMSGSNIGEAFGHNRALFVADKVAKWHNEEFRNIVDSTGHIISCNKNLKNFVYYMNTFREKRQAFESNRRS